MISPIVSCLLADTCRLWIARYTISSRVWYMSKRSRNTNRSKHTNTRRMLAKHSRGRQHDLWYPRDAFYKSFTLYLARQKHARASASLTCYPNRSAERRRKGSGDVLTTPRTSCHLPSHLLDLHSFGHIDFDLLYTLSTRPTSV